MNSVKSFFTALLSAFYPNKCISCGEITGNAVLCDYCAEHIEFIDQTKRCKFCGRSKENCRCNRSVYRFCELVSVFEYDTFAKKAIFNYKFKRNEHYARYFVEKMHKCLSAAYPDGFPFDMVTYVPTDKSTVFSRGFDHCEVLAKELSRRLDLPFFKTLKVAKKVGKQHTAENSEQRMKNVKNKYKSVCPLNNISVLLVDDITTTGATLDECARVLLFAGVETVYCATALSSKNKPKTVEKN